MNLTHQFQEYLLKGGLHVPDIDNLSIILCYPASYPVKFLEVVRSGNIIPFIPDSFEIEVFTPVFISGGLIIDMVTEEYERKTIDLLEVAPMSFSDILNGKMLVAVHNIFWILIVTTVMAALIVLLGAIIAVKYRDRTLSQYLYSLILIFLFLGAYLFADSPFNLVTRLSSGAASGMDAFVSIAPYAVAVIPLYFYSGRMRG
ncbi:MAG: ABC transporter permease subunit [Candidatus Methanoperedens sp.]|nr:ABC transporter permease subunit [Candidatus Methanoperedens sp.]